MISRHRRVEEKCVDILDFIDVSLVARRGPGIPMLSRRPVVGVRGLYMIVFG